MRNYNGEDLRFLSKLWSEDLVVTGESCFHWIKCASIQVNCEAEGKS